MGPGSVLPRRWVGEVGRLSRQLPSAEGKQSAAGTDHPRATPTPRREAKPVLVFFSWRAGLVGGSHSWSLTGNRCSGEQGEGKWRVLKRWTPTGHSSGSRGNKAAPLHCRGQGQSGGDRCSEPLLSVLQRLLTAEGPGRAITLSVLPLACHFPVTGDWGVKQGQTGVPGPLDWLNDLTQVPSSLWVSVSMLHTVGAQQTSTE